MKQTVATFKRYQAQTDLRRTKQLQACFDAGVKAFEGGAALETNPYASYAWRSCFTQGWRHAEKRAAVTAAQAPVVIARGFDYGVRDFGRGIAYECAAICEQLGDAVVGLEEPELSWLIEGWRTGWSAAYEYQQAQDQDDTISSLRAGMRGAS